MDKIHDTVISFIKKNYTKKYPLLLALSGGPDSRILFEILLELKKLSVLEFDVAHINHNWRGESFQEMEILKKLCEFNEINFHHLTLNPPKRKENLEENARIERFKFYKQLYKTNKYEAVLLGHQMDDQIETVLKRVFEGASLPNLRGIQEITFYEEMILWRPLLKVSKKTIYEFLKQKNIQFFEDSTNNDPSFLRARMRNSLIPQINQSFGKEIGSSLIRISKQAQELNEFLMPFWQDFAQFITETKGFIWIDFTSVLSQPFLLKYFLRNLFKTYLSNSSELLVEVIFEQLVANQANKTHCLKDVEKIYVDRGHLFIKNREHFTENSWKKEEYYSEHNNISDWKGFISNEMIFALPHDWEESYQLVSIKDIPDSHKIRKWFSNHKVPHFLVSEIPLIYSNGKVVHEFLTGKFFFGKKVDLRNSKRYRLHPSLIPAWI